MILRAVPAVTRAAAILRLLGRTRAPMGVHERPKGWGQQKKYEEKKSASVPTNTEEIPQTRKAAR